VVHFTFHHIEYNHHINLLTRLSKGNNMLIKIEIISGQILTVLETAKTALTFDEIKAGVPEEPKDLILRSLMWLIREGLITENDITNEFKIRNHELEMKNDEFEINKEELESVFAESY